MNSFSIQHFTVNTAEEKEYYFTGEQQYNYDFNKEVNLFPSGNYRIIDGELSQIISGINLSDLQKKIAEQNQNA